MMLIRHYRQNLEINIFLNHEQEEHGESGSSPALESPPKKLLFWENNRSSSAGGKMEELMTVRIREMEAVTELREMRVRLMELETQVSFIRSFIHFIKLPRIP